MHRFPIPAQRLKLERINEEAFFRSEKLFDSFPIHSINLLIPSSVVEKQKFEEILIADKNVYFIIKDISAKCLIEKAFLEHFIKSGSVLATSYNARVEVENFLSIIYPGKLILSLEKNISSCLALCKENSNKKKKARKTFETMIINLNCSDFSPGKKMYEFVAFELSKIEHIKFTLLLKWTPHGNVCAQSIKTYFASQNIEYIACKPNHEYSSKFSVTAPQLQFDIIEESTVEDLLEWVGAVICGIEYSNVQNEYASKFFSPVPSQTLKKLHRCSFEGFYSKTETIPVIKEIRKMFQADSSLPFVVACFSGFQDSFVIENGFQHFSSADKLICVIAFPSSNYWIITLNVR